MEMIHLLPDQPDLPSIDAWPTLPTLRSAVDVRGFKRWLKRNHIAVQPALARRDILTFLEPVRSSIQVTGRGELRWTGSAAQLYVGYQLGLALYPNREVEVSLTRELQAYLRRRDGDGCFYCGRAVARADASIEHILARAYGGANHAANLVLAHRTCNELAGSLPVAGKIRLRDALRRGLGA